MDRNVRSNRTDFESTWLSVCEKPFFKTDLGRLIVTDYCWRRPQIELAAQKVASTPVMPNKHGACLWAISVMVTDTADTKVHYRRVSEMRWSQGSDQTSQSRLFLFFFLISTLSAFLYNRVFPHSPCRSMLVGCCRSWLC